ncbi:MAG: hypothetical protein U0744_08960 [Gemmataceae bacterium]
MSRLPSPFSPWAASKTNIAERRERRKPRIAARPAHLRPRASEREYVVKVGDAAKNVKTKAAGIARVIPTSL